MEQTPGSLTGSPSTTGASGTSSVSGTAPSTAQEVKAKAQQVAREAKGKAQQTAQRLKEEGKQQLETGKEGAAQKADQLADAVNRASYELHGQQEHGLADYASQVASGISHFADTLRNRSIDDLIAETETLARRNPAVFFLGSVGVGLALSRFLKASARHAHAASDAAGSLADDLDVSYDAASEWQQPEASQSIYGGQPGAASSESSNWSTEARGNDFDVRPGGGAGAAEAPSPSTNNPTGGAHR